MSRMMGRVLKLERIERRAEGPGRIFFTTIGPEVPEDQHEAFLATARARRGITEGDIHMVTIYEAKP